MAELSYTEQQNIKYKKQLNKAYKDAKTPTILIFQEIPAGFSTTKY